LRPIDKPHLIESVSRTGRLLSVYEGVTSLGIGAEISAIIAESAAFSHLKAPLKRLGGAEVPLPYNPELEKAAVPQVNDILAAVHAMMQGEAK
jgi:pyruvate dehydrogenase E1 component beta subunit